MYGLLCLKVYQDRPCHGLSQCDFHSFSFESMHPLLASCQQSSDLFLKKYRSPTCDDEVVPLIDIYSPQSFLLLTLMPLPPKSGK